MHRVLPACRACFINTIVTNFLDCSVQFDCSKMITKIFFILFLLSVRAQLRLTRLPRSCSVPKSTPKCMYSRPTPYFKSCGIYDGGDCSRFCRSLLAQYRPRPRVGHRCFRFKPSTIGLKRIYASCIYRCANAKRSIRRYRTAGLRRLAPFLHLIFWKASNIKALIYLSVNRRDSVTSRVQVYTSNNPTRCRMTKKGKPECWAALSPLNYCTCSTCWHYKAVCPSCCRYRGYIWVS